MVFGFTNRHSWLEAVPAMMLGALLYPACTVTAGDARTPAPSALETIVVKGQRLPQPVADAELETQVTTALHDDPYFYDEHVTVTVSHGVVYLEGEVLDAADAEEAWRIVKRKFPGVKRVVNELEVVFGYSDAG